MGEGVHADDVFGFGGDVRQATESATARAFRAAPHGYVARAIADDRHAAIPQRGPGEHAGPVVRHRLTRVIDDLGDTVLVEQMLATVLVALAGEDDPFGVSVEIEDRADKCRFEGFALHGVQRFGRREHTAQRQRFAATEQEAGDDVHRRRIAVVELFSAASNLGDVQRKILLAQVKRGTPELALDMIRAPERGALVLHWHDDTAEKQCAPVAELETAPPLLTPVGGVAGDDHFVIVPEAERRAGRPARVTMGKTVSRNGEHFMAGGANVGLGDRRQHR